MHEHIETIEAGYEFLLAYAAQGRDSDDGTDVRDTLENMQSAASGIMRDLRGNDLDFAAVVVDDARKTIAAIRLVLAQGKISSELADNLNASIHVRALLTDLFLLSETAA